MSSHPSPSASDWAAQLLDLLGADPRTIAPVQDSAPIADWAASGAVLITGTPEQPLLPNGFAATAARGALLALDALVGPLGVAGHELLGERAAISGWDAKAPWSLGGHCQSVSCTDGWLALSLARDSDLDLLPALTQDAGATSWSDVQRWASGQPTDAAVDRCRLLGLPAGTVGEVPARPMLTVRSSGPVAPRPLAGLRVVDLSSLWAGPLCADLLGRAGAQVIRVESTARPDGGRRGIPKFDDLLHAGQRSVAFDPDDLDLLHRLVDRADLVITAARPRGLASLGLDPERFAASRAHGVWVQLSAYGSHGPEANWVGFGDDVAMSAGLVRWVDGRPVPVADALADPLAGMHAAVAAAALAQRGGSHVLQLSLADVARATTGGQPDVDPVLVDGCWTLDTEFGTRVVAAPSARPLRGAARRLGADTEAVRAELGA